MWLKKHEWTLRGVVMDNYYVQIELDIQEP